ncbi:MAG TPA: M1 family aminopeptidase, partial [Chitinophagaceae bacterium]
EKELAYYKQLGSENNKTTNNKKYQPQSTDPVKTLKYSCENIHDFAWYADKDFIIEYDTMSLPSGKTIDVFAYHPDYGNKLWNNGTSYIKDAVRKYSSWIGEYPYPVVQAVEGPKNLSSGGMEYPTITLITSPDADESRLDGVITHEVGHNWFYGILASNERDHAWMDEGINTYYQFRYEHAKYKTNSIFGDAIPKEVREKPVDELEGVIYMALSEIPMDREIDLSAEEYANKEEYGTVVYLKTAIWMYLIELMEGREPLDKGLKAYYEKWKFKHPYPEDFRAVMEETMGKKLDTYFDLLKKKGSLK